jgi:hypothetical protein
MTLTPPWLLALALVIGLIVLVPARLLQLAGVSGRAIGGYALLLWLFAMTIAIRPGATRLLIPFLLVAYIAPFVAAPDTVRRVFRRRPDGVPAGEAGVAGADRPPMKNVTPPDADPGADEDDSARSDRDRP